MQDDLFSQEFEGNNWY